MATDRISRLFSHALLRDLGIGSEPWSVFTRPCQKDVLTYMTFPRQHWTKLHSTNPIERLNGEIKRRTEVVGIFPNDDAIVRLVGALLLEQNDEWAVQRSRYLTLEIGAQGCLDTSRLICWSPSFRGR